jgi:hypothetical protein
VLATVHYLAAGTDSSNRFSIVAVGTATMTTSGASSAPSPTPANRLDQLAARRQHGGRTS